jgi:signal transduction histidine kinase
VSPAEAVELAMQGISLDTYAAYIVALDLLFATVCWLTGAMLLWRQPADRSALLGVIMLVTLGAGLRGALEVLPLTYPALSIPLQLLAAMGLSAVILFLYTFPDGRFAPRWALWLALPWIVGDILSILQRQIGEEHWYGPLGLLGFVLFLIPAVGVIIVQVIRYRSISTTQRLQVKWVVFGLSIAVGGMVFTALMRSLVPAWQSPSSLNGMALEALGTVLFLSLPVSLTVAMLRFRLWNIEPLIRRALVYGTLTVTVAGLYVFIVGYLAVWLRLRDSLLLSLILTGLIAVTVQPLRDWLQRGVDRLIYGQRHNPYAVVSDLGQRLETTYLPDAVLPAIAETVQLSLRLPYVAIWLERQGELQLATQVGAPLPDIESLPLTYQQRTIGELRVATRHGEDELSPNDRSLLITLARLTGVVAYAFQLTQALQQAREQLVAAREEERRRLRRDLHDGLGAGLTAIAMQAEAASSALQSDLEEVENLLKEITEQAQANIIEVRRISHGLRPPVLDDLGLTGALRALLADQSYSSVQFSLICPEQLPSLPAAVEVAAYRIVQEAITNVARHSGATQGVVELQVNQMLHLSITDDGRGLRLDNTIGVGLHSMRERAEELGGEICIESSAGSGVYVRVTLPLSQVPHDNFAHQGLNGWE